MSQHKYLRILRDSKYNENCLSELTFNREIHVCSYESVNRILQECSSFYIYRGSYIYYIPITDRTLELYVFWPSDTESRINGLRFSESISLSFKTRLTLVSCFCGDVT